MADGVVVPLRSIEVVASCLVLVWWWVVVCGWFRGLWVARFCVWWCGGGGSVGLAVMAWVFEIS